MLSVTIATLLFIGEKFMDYFIHNVIDKLIKSKVRAI